MINRKRESGSESFSAQTVLRNDLSVVMRICLPAAVFVLSAASAPADLVVNIPDAVLNAGSTGSLEVTLTGTAPANLVRGYDFEFRLTPTGGTTTTLRFVDPQAESQLSDSDYIFFGDSDAVANSSTVTSVATTSLPNDTLNGADTTNSGGTVTVGSSDVVLATLDILHFLPGGTDPSTTIGHSFTLTLAAANFVDGSVSAIPFTSNSGTITITAAVPEPSMFVLAACASVGFVLQRRRRRPDRIVSDEAEQEIVCA